MPVKSFAPDFDAQIAAEGLAEQLMALEKLPVEMTSPLVKAVKQANQVMKNAERPRVKQFTGRTARSIGSSVKVNGPGSVTGITGPSKRQYFRFRLLQDGRSPGATAPWHYDLIPWVESKWGTTGKESERAAFLLARSIHENGIQGTPIARPVMNEKKAAVLDLLARAMQKIVEGLKV